MLSADDDPGPQRFGPIMTGRGAWRNTEMRNPPECWPVQPVRREAHEAVRVQGSGSLAFSHQPLSPGQQWSVIRKLGFRPQVFRCRPFVLEPAGSVTNRACRATSKRSSCKGVLEKYHRRDLAPGAVNP